MVSSEAQPLLNEPQSHGFRVRAALNAFPRPSEAGLSCPDESQPLDTPDPPRSLTFMNGLALVIGIQIGSGIFSTPSAIFDDVGSPEAAMLVWLLAGFLAWTGAASFIELGSIVPHNGGAQEYLRHCYNDICGFLAALTWVLVVKPISVAMVSLVFSEYLYRAFTLQETPSIWILKGVALLVVILITYMNCIGTKVGAGTANVFLVLKLFGLGSIIVTGLALGVMSFQSTNETQPTPGGRIEVDLNLRGNFGAYTDATLAALWTYSGWESLGLVTGELQDPVRNVPRVLNGAMALVVSLFILTNAAYFIALPLDQLGKTNTIALDFGRTIFGPTGTIFYTWIVCLSCFGALNAKIFTAGRLTQAAVRRKYLPAFLATFSKPAEFSQTAEHSQKSPNAFSIWKQRLFHLEENHSVPINAMVLNSCLASIYILLGSFRSLLTFVGMAEYVMCFAAVAGVLVLRVRSRSIEPGPGPPIYRTFILNPVLYCVLSVFVVARSAVKHPVQGLIIVVFNCIGVAVYRSRWWQRFVRIGKELS